MVADWSRYWLRHGLAMMGNMTARCITSGFRTSLLLKQKNFRFVLTFFCGGNFPVSYLYEKG